MKATFCGLLLFVFLSGFSVQAQEAQSSDAIEVTASNEQQAEERDEIEPAVSSTVLVADVNRRENENGVMDELNLGRTEITGNQELPTVLYIVPWQKSDPGDLMGRPVNTLLDEVLAPVDRTEFVRKVGYYDDLYGEGEN
jgi:hypothetical protein